MPPKKKARRSYGSGSIVFDASKKLFVGRIRLGYKPDGSRRIVTRKGKDWQTVADALDDAKILYRDTGKVENKRTTVAQWGEKWLTEIASRHLGPNTYATHASLMRKWVVPTIGTRVVSELTPADIRRIQGAMEANTVNGVARPLSTTTALQCYRMLSKCLEAARREGLTAVNICEDVDPPRKAVSNRGSFTVDEVMRIITAAATDTENGTLKITQLFTGTRQGEKLGLLWEHVDFDSRAIRVSWQLQELTYRHGCGTRGADGVYPCGYKQGGRCPSKAFQVPDGYEYRVLEGKLALTRPKSKAGERIIPMIEPVALALAAHRQRTEGQANPHGLVFHRDGRPIPEKDDQAMWKGLLGSVGIPQDRTTHWARHSVASLLKAAGVDTRIIGEIVGHGSTAVTDNYIHISSDQAMAAMGRLDQMLSLPASVPRS